MYKSKYNFIFKLKSNEWCFFNTLKGSLVILNEKEKMLYDEFVFNRTKPIPQIIQDMLKLGFIHDGSVDEKSILTHSRLKRIYTEKSAYIRILTTTNCNAMCEYCYEHSMCESSTMNEKIAISVAKFIKENFLVQTLNLHWFGGEPLMNYKVIDIIADEIINNMPNTNFKVSMTSNGSLITEDIIKKMVKRWKLTYIQITLDDVFERYNEIKKYCNSKFSYDIVINNIEKLLDNGIKVNIRINYKPNDVSVINRVCIELMNRFESYYKSQKLLITPSPIFENCEIKSKKMPIDDKSQYSMFEALKNVYESCNKINDNIFDLHCKGGRCYACHNNSFVISPNGKLYKCTLAMNSNGTSVGDVINGISYNKEYYSWINDRLNERCENCICLPLCQGGCKAYDMGYINHSCNYIAVHLEEIIRYKLSHNLTFKDNYADCYSRYFKCT